MAYYNDASNADYYSFVSGEAYSYPSPCQTFVTETERTYEQIYAGPTDQWSVVRQSGPMIGSSTSLRATDSFGEHRSGRFIDWCLKREPPESVAPTTSYASRTDDCWPSYDWSAAYRQAQPYHSGYFNRDVSFTDTAAPETSTAVHAPSSGGYPFDGQAVDRSQAAPLDYQRTDRSGATSSTSYMVGFRVHSPLRNPANTFPQGNVNTSHWQWTGPTGFEMTQARRYQPYPVPRTRPNLYENAEAGPSTLVAPSVLYTGQPTTQPSGGISERRADAQTTYLTTEKLRAAVSNFYCSHISRVT